MEWQMKVHDLPPQVVLDNENNWLYRHRRTVTSQNGEDGMIEKIFSLIEPTNRKVVEFGAWDGVHFSNSFNLIRNHGWGGALIEGDPERFQQLRQTHSGREDVVLVNRKIGLSGPDCLDAVLADTGLDEDIDLMSIDIDGADWHVWNSLERYAPKVLVIEFNPTIPSNVEFVQAPDATLQQGSSLLAMIELGKRKGYELVGATWVNAFFVRREYYERFGIADNSIRGIGFNVIGDQVFYLFDGHMIVTGPLILPYHGIQLELDDIQPLPRSERYFKPARPRKVVMPKSLRPDD